MPNKIIGLICAWGAEDWIEPSIEQALNMCNEVIVSIGPFTEEVKKNEDATMERALKYKDRITFVDSYFGGTHAASKGVTLTNMLKASKLYEVGNWVWQLEVDEFFVDSDIREITNAIRGDYDRILWDEMVCFINMQHYLKNERGRLRKIVTGDEHFVHVNRWTGELKDTYRVTGVGCFHTSLLSDQNKKKRLLETEHWGTPNKSLPLVKWIDRIYHRFDLADEQKWIDRNELIFGHKSPFPFDAYFANEDGGLYKYAGPEYPAVLVEREYHKIKDFRELYK